MAAIYIVTKRNPPWVRRDRDFHEGEDLLPEGYLGVITLFLLIIGGLYAAGSPPPSSGHGGLWGFVITLIKRA